MFKTIGILLLAFAGIRYLFSGIVSTSALTFGLGSLAIGVVVNQRTR